MKATCKGRQCAGDDCKREAYCQTSGAPLCHRCHKRWVSYGSTEKRPWHAGRQEYLARPKRSPRPCEIEGCEKQTSYRAQGRWLCASHGRRLRKRGTVEPYTPPSLARFACAAPECARRAGTIHSGKPLCDMHYQRWVKYGTTELPKRQPKSKDRSPFGPCSAAGCKRRVRSRLAAHCERHYYAERRKIPEKMEGIRARNAQRELAKRGVETEKFLPREIFERDNWVCQLCGGRIRRGAKHPHPQSASIDHIVPISKGGKHTRKNTQCAHLRCNVARSNRGPAQMRLLG